MLNYQLRHQIDLGLDTLSLIPEFARMGRLYSVRASIDQVQHMFLHMPDLYLFGPHTSEDKWNNQNEEPLRALLYQLQSVVAREANFLQNILENEIMSGYCLREIHARLSMMLHDYTPLARAHEDNCLVDMEISALNIQLHKHVHIEEC